MNISKIFIIRPVMTTLVMLAILISGVMGYRLLPVSDLPNVDFPTIEISASLPGTNPETMAASIATPLEKSLSTIAGIDSMISASYMGLTRITLQFDLNRDIDAAAQDVQSAIASTLRNLPQDMTSPPSYRKVNPADQPILFIVLSSEILKLSQINEYAETNLVQRISMINGVAQVNIYGSQKYAVRIQLNPYKLASYGLGVNDISDAIKKANVNLPTGQIYSSVREYTIQANGQLINAESYKNIIIAYNGSPIRLEQVANCIDSVEETRRANWFDNARAIVLAIQKQPGSNTVEIVQNIKKLMPTFQAQLPASVKLGIMFDRSAPIEESIKDVKFTLILTMFLVILVIFLFLRNFSATFIPSLALPMSIVGTFGCMYLLGYTLDNISLMSLTLAVGFVVDDAIVMLENIVRHMEQGKKPFESAIDGSQEIGFTILSMTLSLAAVFIPILLMGGVVGRLFREFAVVISVSILVSGFVSLSLTPMLAAKLLKHENQANQKHGLFYKIFENIFDLMLKAYDFTLKITLKWHFITMLISIGILIYTVYLFDFIPKGFLPSDDIGQIQAVTETDQGISFDMMVKYQKTVADVIAKDPNVESVMSVVGASGPNPSLNSGRLNIKLKSRKQRKLSADQVVASLRAKVSSISGIRTVVQNPPSMSIGARSTRGLYQFTLQCPNTKDLYQNAALFELKLKDLDIIQDINSDLQLKKPEINLEIDRDKASALGISLLQIEDALAMAYSSKQISTIYASNNTYQVLIEFDPEHQKDVYLSTLYIKSLNNKLVPLETLVKITTGVGPLSVNHSGQIPSVTMSFNLKPGIALGDAVLQVEKLARENLPASITTNFQGTAQAFQASFKGLWLLLALSIIVIYIVLGILYESFVHPITILSGLPSAGAGALITLILFKQELGIYAFIGIIMLIGIVKKNAIMMIDFALDSQRRFNKSPKEAIHEGALIRFRPIMMTTLAALMGTLPIAIGFGAGSEARRPLGLAVVGGLLVSQILTLYFTPVYYIYLDKIQSFFRLNRHS